GHTRIGGQYPAGDLQLPLSRSPDRRARGGFLGVDQDVDAGRLHVLLDDLPVQLPDRVGRAEQRRQLQFVAAFFADAVRADLPARVVQQLLGRCRIVRVLL